MLSRIARTLAGSLMVSASTFGAPPTQTVTVVNTPANAVPTVAQGTTQVSGTVDLRSAPPITGSVSVSNAPGSTVAVSGTVSVANQPTSISVSNTTPIPVRVAPGIGDAIYRELVHLEHTATAPAATRPVPIGKFRVIEFVSEFMECDFGEIANGYVIMSIAGPPSGGPHYVFLPVFQYESDSLNKRFAGNIAPNILMSAQEFFEIQNVTAVCDVWVQLFGRDVNLPTN